MGLQPLLLPQPFMLVHREADRIQPSVPCHGSASDYSAMPTLCTHLDKDGTHTARPGSDHVYNLRCRCTGAVTRTVPRLQGHYSGFEAFRSTRSQRARRDVNAYHLGQRSAVLRVNGLPCLSMASVLLILKGVACDSAALVITAVYRLAGHRHIRSHRKWKLPSRVRT